jgi:hypothetical protein
MSESETSDVGTPCESGKNCFINMRLGNSDQDFNQPSTYAAVRQDLSLRPSGTSPWELNGSKKLSMELSGGKQSVVKLKADGQGIAVSKAKVYFHQLGGESWKVPPNFFDPFWRAKLHHFERKELESALGTAGDSNGASIAGNDQASIEGKIQ